MQIQKNNSQTSFKGTPEILYNLGKAIGYSQEAALGRLLPKHSVESLRIQRNYGAVNAHLDAAVQDREFGDFLDTFELHLATPIKGINNFDTTTEPTLQELLNLTKKHNHNSGMPVDSFQVNDIGFFIFQEMFKRVMTAKGRASDLCKIKKLFGALRPKAEPKIEAQILK